MPPEGASWHQEASNIGDQRESQQTAVFIEVRARSDPSPSARVARQVLSYEQEGAALRVKKRVNGYENRCKILFAQ
jgi:hypothetical protein